MEINEKKIIEIVKYNINKDITIFSDSFIKNTIERRIIATNCTNFNEYLSSFETSKGEIQRFFESLLINYSRFFRDPLSFAILEKTILPLIVSMNNSKREIRVWSAGCSSGQEAYSIAILISELSEILGIEIPYRIFATDISIDSIKKGERGIYNKTEIENLKVSYLEKYFDLRGGKYYIIPKLKEKVSFSIYDLLSDNSSIPSESIYGDFDIVFSSNLLFYYNLEIQDKIIGKLEKSVSSRGYLITSDTEKYTVRDLLKFKNFKAPTSIFKKRGGF